MSIASEITRINTNIANAYTKISNKGGTLPIVQNSANLADSIDTIPTGGSGWQRPAGWPDLDSLNDWKSTEEDTKCIIYMTFDGTVNPDLKWFSIRSMVNIKTFNIDIGYIDNNQFVSIETIKNNMGSWRSFHYNYKDIQRDYVIFKIYSDNCIPSIALDTVSAATTGKSEIGAYNLPCLEAVGHFAHQGGNMNIISNSTQRYYFNIIEKSNSLQYDNYLIGYSAQALISVDIYMNDWGTLNVKTFNVGNTAKGLSYLNFHGNITDATRDIGGQLQQLIKYTNPPSYRDNVDINANKLSLSDLNLVLDRLYDYSETETTKTITVGWYNLVRLSSDKIAQVNAKGWTLA